MREHDGGAQQHVGAPVRPPPIQQRNAQWQALLRPAGHVHQVPQALGEGTAGLRAGAAHSTHVTSWRSHAHIDRTGAWPHLSSTRLGLQRAVAVVALCRVVRVPCLGRRRQGAGGPQAGQGEGAQRVQRHVAPRVGARQHAQRLHRCAGPGHLALSVARLQWQTNRDGAAALARAAEASGQAHVAESARPPMRGSPLPKGSRLARRARGACRAWR